MSIAQGITLFSPAHTANPYPTYAQLRTKAPVYRVNTLSGGTFWIITRYQDVMSVLKDPRFVKDFRNALNIEQLSQLDPWFFTREAKMLNQNMIGLDGEDHTRLRTLVA